MTLYTERLILRPWSVSDAEDLYEYARDDRVGPIAGWPPHKDAEDSRRVIETVLSADETYAVCLREDNRAIGSIGLMFAGQSNLALADGEAEVGYWIGVPFWGRGLIPEALREVLRHAFCELGLERVWCGYFDGNTKSKRAQEKCGFTYRRTDTDVYWALMDDVRTEHITCLERREYFDRMKKAVVYIHGQGGNASEAEHYRALFPDSEVIGLDYAAQTPWDAKDEFSRLIEPICNKYGAVTLIANSIGAYFAMHALSDKQVEKAYFISPVADMEELITAMMAQAGVSEKELCEKGEIAASTGAVLSWEYLSYVRAHAVEWSVPTHILYGSADMLVSAKSVHRLAQRIGATLTVMDGGEHWFHTDEQMSFLDRWIREH